MNERFSNERLITGLKPSRKTARQRDDASKLAGDNFQDTSRNFGCNRPQCDAGTNLRERYDVVTMIFRGKRPDFHQFLVVYMKEKEREVYRKHDEIIHHV